MSTIVVFVEGVAVIETGETECFAEGLQICETQAEAPPAFGGVNQIIGGGIVA